jgi:cytochrome c biogenesis protein CcdA
MTADLLTRLATDQHWQILAALVLYAAGLALTVIAATAWSHHG